MSSTGSAWQEYRWSHSLLSLHVMWNLMNSPPTSTVILSNGFPKQTTLMTSNYGNKFSLRSRKAHRTLLEEEDEEQLRLTSQRIFLGKSPVCRGQDQLEGCAVPKGQMPPVWCDRWGAVTQCKDISDWPLLTLGLFLCVLLSHATCRRPQNTGNAHPKINVFAFTESNPAPFIVLLAKVTLHKFNSSSGKLAPRQHEKYQCDYVCSKLKYASHVK